METQQVKQDRLHILFWVIKDSCWLLGFKLLGTCMIAPTLILSGIMCFKQKKDKRALAAELSVFFWISANSTWMLDEFFDIGTKNIAAYFFIAGLFCISYSYFTPFLTKTNTNK